MINFVSATSLIIYFFMTRKIYLSLSHSNLTLKPTSFGYNSHICFSLRLFKNVCVWQLFLNTESCPPQSAQNLVIINFFKIGTNKAIDHNEAKIINTASCIFLKESYIHCSTHVKHTHTNTKRPEQMKDYQLLCSGRNCKYNYNRGSFFDGSFYDSLLRPLSSRTEPSRLVVHHCRNSSVLSVLSALLALSWCACVSSFSILVQFF
jgi:hypothetical protein